MNKTNCIINYLKYNSNINNKIFSTLLLNNKNGTIRNMSILSKRMINDKPQELKPSSSERKRKLDQLNPHLRREKPKEQTLDDILAKFKKPNQLTTTAGLLDQYNDELDGDIEKQIEKYGDKFKNFEFQTVEDLYRDYEELEEDGNDDDLDKDLEEILGQDEMLMRPGKDLFTETLKSINNPEDLAQEYINRLLIDEYQQKIGYEEMFHQMITEIPEWNDYNNHVLREVQQLEEEEVAYEGVDNARLTRFWNLERIKTVEAIRKQHFKRVEGSILKNFKKHYKELDIEFNKEIEELSLETGLTIDQLKEHKDYASLFNDNQEDKDVDELFQTKDDIDIALEKVIGGTAHIPNDFKLIYNSINKSITDGKSINSSEEILFENAAIETKKQEQQQQQQQQQYLYKQQQQEQDTFEINNQSQPQQPKLNFSDIIKKQQSTTTIKNNRFDDDEEFDLKSILNNMSSNNK